MTSLKSKIRSRSISFFIRFQEKVKCFFKIDYTDHMKWEASAPSNIALIKYMGKKNSSTEKLLTSEFNSFPEALSDKNLHLFNLTKRNLPLNDSLSFTLNHFVTKVEILSEGMIKKRQDEWRPLNENGFQVKLDCSAQKRFLDFFRFLKEVFHIKGFYKIRSGNNFPHSAGLASSASSFAALTLATYKLAKSTCFSEKDLTLSFLAQLSRLGSGSSCRSFFSPWSLWRGHTVQPIKFPWSHLIHQVIVVKKAVKKISSSEAHKKVLSSPLFEGRPERASIRFSQLLKALNEKKWEKCYSIVWEEFCDMHQLFETSSPPFSYKTSAVKEVLKYLSDQWKSERDGPLVTMDAGSAIHLLYRPDQKSLIKQIEKKFSHLQILFSKDQIGFDLHGESE